MRIFVNTFFVDQHLCRLDEQESAISQRDERGMNCLHLALDPDSDEYLDVLLSPDYGVVHWFSGPNDPGSYVRGRANENDGLSHIFLMAPGAPIELGPPLLIPENHATAVALAFCKTGVIPSEEEWVALQLRKQCE